MSVRRCTNRHRHTPTLAVPSGARGIACRPAKAETQLQSESLHLPPPLPPPPTPPQTRRNRAPWTQSAGVHGLKSAPSSDPECGPNPALFSSGEKCEKPLAQRHLQHQREMKKLLNPVLGASLEDLHYAELECQWLARRETQLNSVLGVNLDDLHAHLPPARPRAGMSTICSAISCWSEEQDTTVGTSTNWSAICG